MKMEKRKKGKKIFQDSKKARGINRMMVGSNGIRMVIRIRLITAAKIM